MRASAFGGSAIASGAAALLALLGSTIPAAAQQPDLKFELTPYAAYRIGGSFEAKDDGGTLDLNESGARGLMLDIRANAFGQWEILYARQDTELSGGAIFDADPLLDLVVEYYHFGGTYVFDGETARPFIALTLGLTRFVPEPSDLGAENYLSASFGGGVQLRADKRVGVRLEGRLFSTFVRTNSALFCTSAGGAGSCLIQVQGKALTQLEARAGLVFRF
jgi:hypothetical protein